MSEYSGCRDIRNFEIGDKLKLVYVTLLYVLVTHTCGISQFFPYVRYFSIAVVHSSNVVAFPVVVPYEDYRGWFNKLPQCTHL